jgi:hydroxymethylpyrimidine pyrophosphatase-like HAD family hydrolase
MLLAIDLDGTLLTPDRTITPPTVNALRAVRERGYDIILIPARRSAWPLTPISLVLIVI